MTKGEKASRRNKMIVFPMLCSKKKANLKKQCTTQEGGIGLNTIDTLTFIGIIIAENRV